MTDLARLANDHMLAAFRGLVGEMGGEFRHFGRLPAFVSGVPLSFANGCMAVDDVRSANIEAAVEWLSASRLPYTVRIDMARAPRMIEVCAGLGLERSFGRQPGMVLRPVPVPPPASEPVSTVRVGHANHPEYCQVMLATGLSPAEAEAIVPRSMVDDPDKAMCLGYLDGRPVATALAIRTASVTGIYAVGTIEEARRRGVGTAVTWAVVGAARDWGSSAIVLRSTEMGYSIYRAMGFEPVVEYARFSPPPAAGHVTQ